MIMLCSGLKPKLNVMYEDTHKNIHPSCQEHTTRVWHCTTCDRSGHLERKINAPNGTVHTNLLVSIAFVFMFPMAIMYNSAVFSQLCLPNKASIYYTDETIILHRNVGVSHQLCVDY
jgi:hypothetical protein